MLSLIVIINPSLKDVGKEHNVSRVTMSDKSYVNGVTAANMNGDCSTNGNTLLNGTATTTTNTVDQDEKIAGVFYNAREEAW